MVAFHHPWINLLFYLSHSSLVRIQPTGFRVTTGRGALRGGCEALRGPVVRLRRGAGGDAALGAAGFRRGPPASPRLALGPAQ